MRDEQPITIPEGLEGIRGERCWHLWDTVTTRREDGTTRKTKVPLGVSGGGRGAGHRAGLGTWDEAVAGLELYRQGREAGGDPCGVGIDLHHGPGVSALDFDACIDAATGEIAAWAGEILEEVIRAGVYVEVSPSGTGIRAIGVGMTAESPPQKVVWKPGVDRLEGGKTPAIEVFHRCRSYVTVTGRPLVLPDRGEVRGDVWANLGPLVDRLIGEAAGQRTARIAAMTGRGTGDVEVEAYQLRGEDEDIAAAAAAMVNSDETDWDEWNRVVAAFYNASGGTEAGFEAACAWSEKSGKHDEDDLRERWSHFARGSAFDQVGMHTLVALAREAQPGWRKPSRVRLEQDLAAARCAPEVDFDDIEPEPPGAGGGGGNGGQGGAGGAGGSAGAPPGAAGVHARGWGLMEVGGKVRMVRLLEGGLVQSMPPREVEMMLAHLPRVGLAKVVGNGQREVTAVQAWLEWTGKRVWKGMGIWPVGAEPKGMLNLWTGFGVPPAQGTEEDLRRRCPAILRHIREVICDGDAGREEWLLNWVAHGVQNVGTKTVTNFVMKGEEGTGKGLFARILTRIYGEELTEVVTQAKHLVGAFNAHLANKALIFADEAFFAGDRKAEGALKALGSEERMVIERKGVDAARGRNVARVIMSTNHDFAIPAGVNARRWAVYEVSGRYGNGQPGRAEYFAALRAEIEDDGALGAFLGLMLARAVDGELATRVPATRALVEQKEMTLRGPLRWWMERLTDGALIVGAQASSAAFDERPWARAVSKHLVYEAYEAWAQKQRSEYEVAGRALFWREMRKAGGLMGDTRPRGDGEQRPRTAMFKTLQGARKGMQEYLRARPEDMPWHGEDDLAAGGEGVVIDLGDRE